MADGEQDRDVARAEQDRDVARAEQGVALPAERDLFGSWFFDRWPWPRSWGDLRRVAESVQTIQVEEHDEGDVHLVRAELPGIDPERDVEIEVCNHVLSIRAQRRQDARIEEAGRVRSEFRYGAFARVVPLPPGAAEDRVEATYRDGILEVRVPVDRQRAGATRIPIRRD